MEEVRYQMLRPAQIIARRQNCPVAYVPLGNVEWHGIHNPLGLDTLKAEGIAVACARKGGGLVLPPLYYGECRLEALRDNYPPVIDAMELPAENFEPGKMTFTATEQILNYQKLLLHILDEVQSLGFEVGVLVPGHGPLLAHARSAVLLHNCRANKKMLAWAFYDDCLVRDKYPDLGDHGGGWETSLLMALHPETVDLDLLPPEPEKVVGADGPIPPQDASAEFGREILDAVAETAVAEVRHRLENPRCYFGADRSFDEGLWK